MKTVTLTDWEVLAIDVALANLSRDTNTHTASLEALQKKIYGTTDNEPTEFLDYSKQGTLYPSK